MFLYCSEANVFGRCCWWNLQGQGFSSFDHTLLLHYSHVDRYHFIVDFSLLVSSMRFNTSKECLSLWLFLRLECMKVGKRKWCRSCFTMASWKCSYFYTTFGTKLELVFLTKSTFRAEWTWTQWSHVWCFGTVSENGAKMMYKRIMGSFRPIYHRSACDFITTIP